MKEIEYSKSRQAVGLNSPVAATAGSPVSTLSTLLPGCQLSEARTAPTPTHRTIMCDCVT